MDEVSGLFEAKFKISRLDFSNFIAFDTKSIKVSIPIYI
jgi:hypothetical protein